MKLPAWSARDWRALIALVASVVVAAVLTGFAAWLVYIIWRGGWHGLEPQRLDALAKALFGILFILAVVLVSLGLAINKRVVKVTLPGGSNLDMEGGDDDGGTPAA